MTITALPSLVRTSPTFKTEVDAYFGTELPAFSVEAEAARVEINANTVTTAANTATAVAAKDTAVIAAGQAQSIANAPQYTDVSTTSLTIGTGTKVFTITAGKSYGTGMTLVASNGTNSMTGTVTSYMGTTLTLNITSIIGSGTFASWTIGLAAVPAVGSGGTTITGNVTLTASSSAAMSVTPTTQGLYVTLPDATTCTKADNLYSVYNAGDFDYGVKDSAGTQLGWMRARTGVMIGLADNATAAGVWVYYGLEKTGITASLLNSTLVNMSDTLTAGTSRISVDANRTAFLFGGTDCYVIVYNHATQTWGAATLVRSSTQTATFTGILASTDLLLVCTCNTTTGMETVTISLSNVTPTVNSGTKASTTLAGNITAAGAGFGRIVAVGSSWVVTYSRATTTCGIRAITVSGTTPIVGAETALSTGVADVANLYASGSIVRTICLTTSTNLTCNPYTVSGSTLSAGTSATVTCAASSQFRSFVNGNGNIVVNYDNANHSATVFKLTTTTEVASTAVLSSTAPATALQRTDYAVVSANKTAYISHAASTVWYANILTDNSGTASVGTEITYSTVGNMVGVANFGVSGNNVRFGYSASTQHGQFTLDCSGASPVLSGVVAAIYSSSSTSMPTPTSSNRYGEQSGNQLTAGASSFVLGGNTSTADYLFTAASMRRVVGVLTVSNASSLTSAGPRLSNSDAWYIRTVGTTTIGYSLQRVEAAA